MDINSYIDNIQVKTFADIVDGFRSIILRAKENNIELTNKHYVRLEKHLFDLGVFDHGSDGAKMQLIMKVLRSEFSYLQQSIGLVDTAPQPKVRPIKQEIENKSTNDYIDPNTMITTPEDLAKLGIPVAEETSKAEDPQWLIDMRKKAEGIE